MKQYPEYIDERLHERCTYCDEIATTRDHVPAKVFLLKPYPPNLSIVPACEKCNNAFSKDEVYLAFLIDYLIALESSESENSIERVIERYKTFPIEDRVLNKLTIDDNGRVVINIEQPRVENVLRKFAVSHMLYETGSCLPDMCMILKYSFLSQLTPQILDMFNRPYEDNILPEMGSRLFIRIFTEGNSWVTIQKGSYRYFVNAGSKCFVRFVIKEFLYCEVIWNC